MNVTITDDFVYIKPPEGYKTFTQQVLNGVYSKRYDAYRFPKNYFALRELAKAFPVILQNRSFVETGKSLGEERNRLAILKSKSVNHLNSRLRPYQQTDIQFLKSVPSGFIFSEPRTGKTPLSIILMQEINKKKNLVVCPASLIYNWESEFKQWDEGVLVYVASGSPVKRKRIYDNFRYFSNKRKVLIISKDTWRADCKQFKDYTFDTCFIDESHFLRNVQTIQSKAIFEIKATRRYALTGTPTVKHPVDLFGVLKFVFPNRYTSYWQFAERYFQVGEDFMGHKEIGPVKPDRENELQDLILYGVQRKRKDILPWLPEKQYQTIPVVLESKQLKLYERMRDDFLAYLDEDDSEHRVDTSGVLPQLMRLRQLCLDPRLVGFDVRGAKTDAIVEWCDNNREPVVIMSMFTSYLKLLKPELEKLGLKVGEINGEMQNGDKQNAAQAFQSKRYDVLLCNIISAGTGFTLDVAETVVFTDKAWNPAENSQAEDRVTPTSRERNHAHSIITFNCRNTVDDKIDRLLREKKSLTDVVNNSNALRGLV